MTNILKFFDLYADESNDLFKSEAPSGVLAPGKQAALYVTCLAGIFFGPYAIEMATGNYPEWSTIFNSLMHIIFSAFLGFLLLLGIFKLKIIGFKTPFVLQMGAAFAAGLLSGEFLPKILNAFSGG